MAPPSPALGARARPLLLILAAVLLIRLPFLNQAIQGDDVYYLAGAQHAQIDPLHPNHTRYVFTGEVIDLRGHPHPPLNCWVLAGLLALLGDIYEVPFHAAYMLFSLVAALAMWSLAKRFSAQPLLATLLFVATPAFVVNGNSLEADLPFLACWMASVALFVKAAEARSSGWLALAAFALALTALAAYQSVVVVPILGVYLWLRARKWWRGWLVAFVPVFTLVAWQLFERSSTGALPASVAVGYFTTYGFQAFAKKLANAAALTAHAGWIVFPLLGLAAFRKAPRRVWAVVVLAAAGAAFLDWNPLFWASFGIGVLVILGCGTEQTRFLSAWILIFFAAALVLFFAGSARYLLPMAAPVALLVSGSLADRPRWLAAGFVLQLLLSLCFSVVNAQHWDGYRQFARSLARETAEKRVWINGEWGLRFYLEADGGLPLVSGQAVRPGEVMVSSRLAFPIAFTTGGGAPTPLAEREIRSWLPLRLIGLGARSAYSTASLGLRPFDLGTGPIDVVRADAVLERKPAREYLPMNAPEAEQQIVSGVYQIEEDRWRWMSERAVVLLKRPAAATPLQVVLYISDQAPARRVALMVDGQPVAEQTYSRPGAYTLVSVPIAVAGETATVTISVDKIFTAPGDHRRLGIILSEVGFKAAQRRKNTISSTKPPNQTVNQVK